MSEDVKRDDRSMSEILASIRKIVTDEERSRRDAEHRRAEAAGGDTIFELTPAMRVDSCAITKGEGAASLPGLGKAEVEDIVRRVIREELKGPVGIEISRKVKAVIHDEVRRALEENEPLI